MVALFDDVVASWFWKRVRLVHGAPPRALSQARHIGVILTLSRDLLLRYYTFLNGTVVLKNTIHSTALRLSALVSRSRPSYPL